MLTLTGPMHMESFQFPFPPNPSQTSYSHSNFARASLFPFSFPFPFPLLATTIIKILEIRKPTNVRAYTVGRAMHSKLPGYTISNMGISIVNVDNRHQPVNCLQTVHIVYPSGTFLAYKN